MGFLNQNSTYLGNSITFPVVEGYCGSIGAAMASIDGQQNDFAMFEAALQSDFAEAGALREGADVMALQEVAVPGFIAKIIEFLKKLGSKIHSIFTAFMAKLDSWFKKDTKDFVRKYRKVVVSKADYSKFKTKYSKPKQNGYWDNSLDYGAITIDGKRVKNDDDTVEELTEILLGEALKSSSSFSKAEFKTELHESLYEDKDSVDDWDLGKLNAIMNNLEGGDKVLSNVKKTNDHLQSNIKKAIARLSKDQENVSKKYPKAGATADFAKGEYSHSINIDDDGNTVTGNYHDKDIKADRVDTIQKRLGRMQKEASAHQAAMLTYSAAVMNEIKFGITQDRRVIAAAVAYKAVKEDAILIDAIGECEQYECESAFEAMEMLA